MSTLEVLFSTERKILSFIRDNSEVSDLKLKRQFDSFQSSDDIPELYEVIDNLMYEGKIQRVYKAGSQVPFYEPC